MTNISLHYSLFLKSQFRKFYWNFSDHITLVFCSAALISLFFYIFRDFVGVQINSLDHRLAQKSMATIVALASFICGFVSGRWAHASLNGYKSLTSLMTRLGVNFDDLRVFRVLIRSTSIVAGLAFSVTISVLLKSNLIGIASLVSISGALIGNFYGKSSAPSRYDRVIKILDWRRHQLIHRSMPGKWPIAIGAFSSLIVPFATRGIDNLFIIQLTLLVCGFLATIGIIQSIAAELPGSWFEKQAGYTHDQWVQSWQHICNAVSLLLATSGGIAWAMLPNEIRAQTWSLPFIAGFAPWLIPSLILQIDGRSKNINMMVMLLISLFLGTAMAATPWAAVALPIIKTQAKSYQRGRYYRA